MNLNELKTYQSDEITLAAEGLRELWRIGLTYGDLKLKELFQIPYMNSVEFKKALAYRQGNVPIKLLLPFYDQIILTIPPISKEIFKRLFDLTPSEISYLYERNRVIPLLFDPIKYVNIPYLDPILRCKPPTLIRKDMFLDVLLGRKVGRSELLSDAFFKGKIVSHGKPSSIWEICEPLLKNRKMRRRARMHYLIPESYNLSDVELVHDFGQRCSELECFDLRGVLSEALESFFFGKKNSPSCRLNIMLWVKLNSLFLTDPLLYGLAGTPQIDEGLVRTLIRMGITNKRNFFFPREIAAFLTDRYKLYFPIDPDLEYIDKAYCDSTISKARLVLQEFEKSVDLLGLEEQSERIEALEDIFHEVREALFTLDKRAEKWKWFQGIIGYGVAGALGLLDPRAGLLAALGYKSIEKKLCDSVAPKIFGCCIRPLPIAIWKFETTLRKIDNIRKYQK